MNPNEFKVAREQRLKIFEERYASLKRVYSDALQKSISETDRARQCMFIKKALEANQNLTALVQEFLAVSDSKTCNITPARIRQLRQDMETYKTQYGEIQQGRDRIYSLQRAYDKLQEKIDIVYGAEFIYASLLAFGLILLVLLMFYSGIRSALDANSISSVIPGGTTQSSYF
jgi:cell fate (sporulation/competence/biofilm development) regulator YlbF (YheA/YmcA/DUF963 family)